MKRSLCYVIVLVVLAFSLAGCDSLLVETPPEASEPMHISIPGNLVADNFSFDIVSATLSSSVTLNSGVDMNVTAEEGKLFLVLCVDATNTTDEIRNLGYFTTYVDSCTILPKTMLAKYGDRMNMTGGVHPGKTMQAYAIYEVPADWSEFELCYMDTLTGSISNSVMFSRSDVETND